jgi:hypothetical protein
MTTSMLSVSEAAPVSGAALTSEAGFVAFGELETRF